MTQNEIELIRHIAALTAVAADNASLLVSELISARVLDKRKGLQILSRLSKHHRDMAARKGSDQAGLSPAILEAIAERIDTHIRANRARGEVSMAA